MPELVSQSMEIVYACCWHNKATNTYHPHAGTLATTTNECSAKADSVLGMTKYQRRARGFRIMPFRLTLAPAWTTVESNVVPIGLSSR